MLLAISFFFVGALGSMSRLEGRVQNNNQRGFEDDDQHLKVTLNSGQYTTHLMFNGTFVFFNLPPGQYYLEIHSLNYIYESAIINVYQASKGPAVNVNKLHPISRSRPQILSNDKQRKVPQRDNMIFEIIEKIEYFEKEEQLSLASIYNSQYFYPIALTVVMLFFLQKLPKDGLGSLVQQ